ncbi:MAG: Sodium/hydrogen exchanger, partial [uncultured bacterium]
MLVQKFAPKLKEEPEDQELKPLFQRILVPISNPASEQNLITMANLLAADCKGNVLAVNVTKESSSFAYEFHKQKELLDKIPTLVDDPESQIELIPRLANTYAEGILMTSKERGASLIFMGWRGKRNLQQNILGSVLDEVIWGSDLPVMVGKLPQNVLGMQRVLLLMPEKVVANEVLRRIIEANIVIAKSLNVPLEILAASAFIHRIKDILHEEESDI